MRYHQTTDSHGNVVMRQCNATVRGCPLGGDSMHHDFHSRETAGYWNEAQRLMDDGVYMGRFRISQQAVKRSHKMIMNGISNKPWLTGRITMLVVPMLSLMKGTLIS